MEKYGNVIFERGLEKKESSILAVFDTIRTVLAVRQFSDQPIPDAVVREIVEAGHLTASAGNQQPWHFIVVQDKGTLQKLGEIAKTGPYIAQSPLTIVVAAEKSAYAFSDVSRAIQDQILTAWEHGVGSNWVGPNDAAQVKSLLGIPDTIDVLALIPFGYPVQSIGKGKKKRKPLAEIAHRERWDQPFA